MRSAVALTLLAMVAGCASPTERSSFGPYPSQGHASSSPQYLYVASLDCPPYKKGCVTEYAPGSTTPLRTIVDGIDKPARLAVDTSGNLYVSNTTANAVTVYAPGSTQPKMTITRGIHSPVSLAISPSGNLYVANTTAPNGRGLKGDVTVYVPGSANPVRTIKKGIWGPRAFAFDRLGNAYVANLYLSGQSADDSKGSVSEYRQGGTAPIRTFTRGINAPLALAFDSKGSFYVANWGAPAAITYPGATGNVRTYQPGQSKPNLKIRQGIGNPYTIAIDSQDVLYVASGYNQRWITEYTRGSTSLLRTVPVDASFDMTLDRQGNLYVGQYARILVYSAGSTTPAYAIPSQGMAFALGDR